MAGKGGGTQRSFTAGVHFQSTGIERVMRDLRGLVGFLERESNIAARNQERSLSQQLREQERAQREMLKLQDQLTRSNQSLSDAEARAAQRKLEDGRRVDALLRRASERQIEGQQRVAQIESQIDDRRRTAAQRQVDHAERIKRLDEQEAATKKRLHDQTLQATRRLQQAQDHARGQLPHYLIQETKLRDKATRAADRLAKTQERADRQMQRNGQINAKTLERLNRLRERSALAEKRLSDNQQRIVTLNERILRSEERITQIRENGSQKAARIQQQFDRERLRLQRQLEAANLRLQQLVERHARAKQTMVAKEGQDSQRLADLKQRHSERERAEGEKILRIKRQIQRTERDIVRTQAMSSRGPSGKGGGLGSFMRQQGAASLMRGAMSANTFAGSLMNVNARLLLVGGTATMTVGIIGSLAAAMGFVAVKAALSYAPLQRMQVQLGAMTGSARLASYAMSSFSEMAGRLPMELNEIRAGSMILQGVGVDTLDLATDLKTLGNVAIATGNKLSDLAVIYGEIKTKGRMYREDVLQMSRRRIPISGQIAKDLGVSVKEFNQMVSDGLITFEVYKEALEKITSDSGLLGDQLEAVAGTFSGKMDIAQNKLQLVIEQFGKLSFELMEPQLMGALTFVTDKLEEMLWVLEGVGKWTGVSPLRKDFESLGYHAAYVGETIESLQQKAQSLRSGLSIGEMVGDEMISDPKILDDYISGLEVIEKKSQKSSSAIEELKRSMALKPLSDEMKNLMKSWGDADPSGPFRQAKKSLEELLKTVREAKHELPDVWSSLTPDAAVYKAIEGASGIFEEMRKLKDEIAVLNSELTETDILMKKMKETGVFDVEDLQAGKILEQQYRTLLEQKEQAEAQKKAREEWEKWQDDNRKKIEELDNKRVEDLAKTKQDLMSKDDPWIDFSQQVRDLMEMRTRGMADNAQMRAMFGQLGKAIGGGPDPETHGVRSFAGEMQRRSLKGSAQNEMQKRMLELWDKFVQGDTAATTKIVNAIQHDLRARAR